MYFGEAHILPLIITLIQFFLLKLENIFIHNKEYNLANTLFKATIPLLFNHFIPIILSYSEILLL